MRRILCLFLLFTIVPVLYGCSEATKESITLPGFDLPLSKFNSIIAIVEDPGTPKPYKNGEMMGFGVENLSDKPVDFSNDMNVEIFQKDGDSWTKIDNPFNYSEDPNYLPGKGNYQSLPLIVIPWIPNLTEVTTIKIVIQGYFADQPKKPVGAFIDIQLNP